ncbi:hypothetical protein [Marinobacter confluentis]|uniref:DUF2502 domain-containing protein n=1 Tax=Marinobacter confluentis TaxID=1697557 RepID=A0A4Z1BWA7_9GAMM|nr:hypothetical protein [Marinobacter confluentis]TGN38950.1 hypothetical protein E5Q11_14570 [Marinobacter confluentis]
MKQFLIGSFILAFLLGATPAIAESDYRQGTFTKVGGADRDGPHHKKFLTSRYHDDHYRGGYKNRGHDRKGHGWRDHHGGDKHWKRSWKKDKWHHRKHRYHGHKRQWDKHHWYKHRHYRDHDDGYRYRFRYNGVLGSDGGPSISSGQIMIDLSR